MICIWNGIFYFSQVNYTGELQLKISKIQILKCIESYSLDPCHFFSAPGLSWQACLKMTSIKLELISDIEPYLFIEKGLIGGISIKTH